MLGPSSLLAIWDVHTLTQQSHQKHHNNNVFQIPALVQVEQDTKQNHFKKLQERLTKTDYQKTLTVVRNCHAMHKTVISYNGNKNK